MSEAWLRAVEKQNRQPGYYWVKIVRAGEDPGDWIPAKWDCALWFVLDEFESDWHIHESDRALLLQTSIGAALDLAAVQSLGPDGKRHPGEPDQPYRDRIFAALRNAFGRDAWVCEVGARLVPP